MTTLYPIRAVAKLTGITLDTLRAWERRYGAVSPRQTNRGRQYGTQEVERLVRLRKLVQNGHAIGSIANLSDEELDSLLEKASRPQKSEPAGSEELHSGVLVAIEDYDPMRASDELARIGS